MKYEAKLETIGATPRHVLAVTADRALSRDELGDLSAFVSGYCRTVDLPSGAVETWFLYPSEHDLQIKGWIAAYGEIPTDPRELKLFEISKACEAAINAGVDVETSVGTMHFNLSGNDQINLLAYKGELATAMAGLPSSIDPEQGVWYKADSPGETHRYWSVEDFALITTVAFEHKVKQLTYCDALKTYVASLTSPEEVAAVSWGMELPGQA